MYPALFCIVTRRLALCADTKNPCSQIAFRMIGNGRLNGRSIFKVLLHSLTFDPTVVPLGAGCLLPLQVCDSEASSLGR